MSQQLDYASPESVRRSGIGIIALTCSSLAILFLFAAVLNVGRFVRLPIGVDGMSALLSLLPATAGTTLCIISFWKRPRRAWVSILSLVLSLGYWLLLGVLWYIQWAISGRVSPLE